VDSIFMSYNIPHTTSKFITIRVERYNTWQENDVHLPQNRIKLLWDDNGPSIPNPTLDGVRSKLEKKRVLSHVGVLSILSFVLLRHLAQPDLLGSPQYRAMNAVKDSVFDTSTAPNIVSKRELDAHNHAVANYINWVDKIQSLSTYLKAGWFTSALVTPRMFEVIDSNETFAQKYKVNRYVHDSIFALMFKISAPTQTLVVELDGDSQFC